jgi:SAM-dependent methyltransferase
MELKHRIKKAFSPDTYSLAAGARNVNRLKWGLKNLPAYFQTVGRIYLDPAARSQLTERRRKLHIDELLAQLDSQELERIRLRYEDGSDSIWPKYLDTRKWLDRNIDYARRFGWLLDPPRDTLDLGCGAGYFLFVMRQLGSNVLGLDLEDPIFNDILRVLRIERVPFRIKRREKLPDFGGRKFDLITAWMICFNDYDRDDAIWGPLDWDYLLNDLTEKLTPKGRIMFYFNAQRQPGIHSRELWEYFRIRADLLDGRLIIFTKSRLARTAGSRFLHAPSPQKSRDSLSLHRSKISKDL